MKRFIIRTTLIILLLPCLASAPHTDMQVVLTRSNSWGNGKYVDKIITFRKPINRTTSLTSTDIYFWPNVSLTSPLYMHINCFKKFATQYKPFMVNIKTELCEALRLKTHPLFKFFWDKTRESDSNILEPCPMKGHRYIKPYYTRYELLPPLLPSGTWRSDLILKKGDEEVFGIINYYDITTKGIAEF